MASGSQHFDSNHFASQHFHSYSLYGVPGAVAVAATTDHVGGGLGKRKKRRIGRELLRPIALTELQLRIINDDETAAFAFAMGLF